MKHKITKYFIKNDWNYSVKHFIITAIAIVATEIVEPADETLLIHY